MNKRLKTLIVFYIATLCLSSCSTNFRYYLDKAEAAKERQNYSSAIQFYKEHIEFREKDRKAPKENPYFYLLMIGDLYLKNEDPLNAEKTFVEAIEKDVSKPLCAERIRMIAKYYSENNSYEEAFKLLEFHRELDPLLFDLDKDNLHKEFIALNQETNQQENPVLKELQESQENQEIEESDPELNQLKKELELLE